MFTGKERDSESMLDYFGARYYGSALGRFTSPDNGIDQDAEAEAVLFAHELKVPANRGKTLLIIAQYMLDKAGAPNI